MRAPCRGRMLPTSMPDSGRQWQRVVMSPKYRRRYDAGFMVMAAGAIIVSLPLLRTSIPAHWIILSGVAVIGLGAVLMVTAHPRRCPRCQWRLRNSPDSEDVG